ncbi:phage tail tape measure protein [Burkholderia vietnamiensis]|uniref:hypothetical protein n=1 Tax=Burkholderia vietnamiensis TaxID=60552 RepID=UPI001CF432E0|nr:hypothetical protein [Burkholderia vietnamiensis]MCA8448565.1 hypothetical protein [Burkholderia vietnamiensis]HDR8955665.1 hypothetical protein [Burkholderia vietnamiensis]
MSCVFRLDGDFLWPPAKDAAQATGTRKGTVEIHFAPVPGGGNAVRAFVRWRPVEQADIGTPPEPVENVFKLADASTWLANHADQDVALWIHAGDAQHALERLAFRGAFLFSQFEPGDDPKIPWIMRWPLVRTCVYETGGKTLYSELVIGQPDSDNKPNFGFRLNFHLPMPLEQTTLADKAVRAMPLSATFQPKADGLDKALLFTNLVGGPVRSGIANASFVFNDVLGQLKLGTFGFAASDTPKSHSFCAYDGNRHPSLKPVDLQRYWGPLRSNAAARACIQSLEYMGLHVGDASKLALKLMNAGDVRQQTPQWLSVRFPERQQLSGANNAGLWKLTYRLTLAPTSSEGSVGKLCWRNKRFYLDLDDEMGGFLDTGSEMLHLDCEVSWTITDDNLWSRDWKPSLALRLHWQESMPADFLAMAPTTVTTPRKGPIMDRGTLGAAALVMRDSPKSLYQVEAAQPQSFLPTLESRQKQSVRFALYAPPYPLQTVDDGMLQWPPSPSALTPTPLRLSIAAPEQLLNPQEQVPPLTLVAQLPAFFQNGPAQNLTLSLTHDARAIATDWSAAQSGNRYFARFHVDIVDSTAWQGRLSSLQFESTGGEHKNAGSLSAGMPPDGASDVRPSEYPFPIAVQFSLKLRCRRVTPLGPDIGRDVGASAAPLLIPLQAAADGTSDDVYYLDTTESVVPSADRQLSVNLMEDAKATQDVDYVVLSQEPFTVTRFSQQPLGARGDAGKGVVATYASQERAWQFRFTARHYRYTLPPQSVGESMDKPRRMEIHDWVGIEAKDGPVLQDGPVPRPYRIFRKIAGGNPKIESFQRRAVEFRLTPSADVWVQPSDVKQDYFMPEWRYHEIFRRRGELGTGVALAALRAEFLYGMPVGVDVARETGMARQARIAEIEALTGRMVDGASNLTHADNRWNKLRPAILRRIERLDVWAQDPDAQVAFAPARFGPGVNFALRSSALVRAPLPALDEPEAPGVPLNPERVSPVGNTAHSIRYHPQGLSGGALWPVESANLFRALAANPQFSGGTLDGVALSPIGGDAAQKASFLNGAVTILSQTRNGFIESQRVEVTGRIGALWHRAKHVVVYERTVNPSNQFAPLLEEDPQRTRSRRPILRKVREFIEIIQHERTYPDFPRASPRTVGFLERVRFNSRIINVDSAWSRDVGDFGWEIPLWNRAAARLRPQVYPKPDVSFCCHAEGEGDTPTVAQECDDSDYLYFFADINGGSDTDIWTTRPGIDYVDMPRASVLADLADAASNTQPEETHGNASRRPPVSRFLPGMRRFTWRLAPASRKVAINAGRSGAPVYVGLESVTFMRAGANKIDGNALPPELDAALKISGRADAGAAMIGRIAYWPSDGTGTEGVKQQFSTHIAALRAAKGLAERDAKFQALKVWLTASLGSLGEALKNEFGASLAHAKALTSNLPDVRKRLDVGKTSCGQMRADALGLLHGKAMLVEALVRDWEADIRIPIGLPVKKADLIGALTDALIAAIRPAFDEATGTVAGAQESVEKAHAILIDLRLQIDAARVAARSRALEFCAAYDASKPWSPARSAEFLDGLLRTSATLRESLTGVIAEARQRLAIELDASSQQLAGAVGSMLRDADAAQRKAIEAVKDFDAATTTLLRDAVDKFDAAGFDVALQNMATIRAKIVGSGLPDADKAALQAALDPIAQAMQQLQVNAKAGRDAVESLRARLTVYDDTVAADVQHLGAMLQTLAAARQAQLQKLADVAHQAATLGLQDVQKDINALYSQCNAWLETTQKVVDRYLAVNGKLVDIMMDTFERTATASLEDLGKELAIAGQQADVVATDIRAALQTAKDALAPGALLDSVVSQQVIIPLLGTLLKPLPDSIDSSQLAAVREPLATISADIGKALRELNTKALAVVDDLSGICSAVFDTADTLNQYGTHLANGAEAYVDEQLKACTDALSKFTQVSADNVNAVLSAVAVADQSVRGIQNDLARCAESASAYGNRVLDAVGKLGEGGVMAAPSNILRLYSAVSSPPDLAALKTDIDRLRASFDELEDVVGTTRVTALFNRLGDELKALGLAFPFDGIGDRLVPADLSALDIGKVFRNLGGARLDRFFKGYKLPADVAKAIVVTHEFNPKQGRAWLQIDIDVPMPGRRSLFSLEVFKADFVDMHVKAQVRFEANDKDSDVTQTGFGRIDTEVDLAVSGQSMVRLEKFGLSFTREAGLKVDFDANNIRLNPALQFVQDFLSQIFPDEIGGMRIIKRDGIPVGLEHAFSMPPLSLNFATSGISNIAISNTFQLTAYPDFVLANHFWLSKPEQPFIFSFFVIGGTGYVHVETEYRPFGNALTVTVEAAAGGSAALGFSFGPFSGQVFITLSVALTYSKRIGRPGGGLSIGAVLVIAGYVNVASIATVGIYLLLRMTYRDNGQVDADGTLSVTIRISQFFKITARANVRYRLRDGHAQTQSSVSVKTDKDAIIAQQVKRLKEART